MEVILLIVNIGGFCVSHAVWEVLTLVAVHFGEVSLKIGRRTKLILLIIYKVWLLLVCLMSESAKKQKYVEYTSTSHP